MADEIKQLPKTPTLPPDTADGGKSLVRALWDHIIQSNETINKLIKAVKQAADYPEITPEGIGAATVKHAENHHARGEDQLTPAAIGAAPAEGSEHYASKQEIVPKVDVGFAFVYPNGGTATEPATITTNQVYVFDNPFPGYYVIATPEVYSTQLAKWVSQSLWWSSGSYGMNVVQDGNSLRLSTGSICLIYSAANGGSGFALSSNLTSAKCRVKVWKCGTSGGS